MTAKFKDPETGEVFDILEFSRTAFENCAYIRAEANCKELSVFDYIYTYPHESAALMGYEVVEDEMGEEMREPQLNAENKGATMDKQKAENATVLTKNDSKDESLEADMGKAVPGTCMECEYAIQIGNLLAKCKITGRLHVINDMCDVKEANMDKPLKDWTLGEVKVYCTGRDCYKDCELAQSPGKCKILDVTPSEWDLDEKPRFTEQEVEATKAIRILFPCATHLIQFQPNEPVSVKAGGAFVLNLNSTLFPSIRPGRSYTLDEIIGGAE